MKPICRREMGRRVSVEIEVENWYRKERVVGERRRF